MREHGLRDNLSRTWTKFGGDLRVKIASILFLLISIPILISSGWLTRVFIESEKKAVFNSQREIVVRVAKEIGLQFKQREEVLKITASRIGSNWEDTLRQEYILTDLLLAGQDFKQAAVFTLQGSKIASTDNWKAEKPQEGSFAGLEHGKITYSGVRQEKDHCSFFTAMIPVLSRGRDSGVLAVDVCLRFLWEAVDNIHIARTGMAFLVSNQGMIIAHPDVKQVLKEDIALKDRDIKAVAAKESGSLEIKDSAGHYWISSFMPIPELSLGVVIRQSKNEAYASLRTLKRRAMGLVILVEVLAAWVCVMLAKRISGRVRAMAGRLRGALNEGAGDNNAPRPRDEIAELVSLFNELAYKLEQARNTKEITTRKEAAAWLAHELKNSLIPIKSFMKMLPKRHTDKQFIETVSNIIPREIDYCERMLKEFSQPEQSPLSLGYAEVKSIFEDALGLMQNELQSKKIMVQRTGPSAPIWSHCDAEKIRQIFMNLIMNAVDAMDQGGVLRMDMKTVCLPGSGAVFAEIAISDTGPGIPREKLSKVFSGSFTTKKGGMGLGLAISKSLVMQHGGSIDVESKEGEGTRFILRIPAKPADDGPELSKACLKSEKSGNP